MTNKDRFLITVFTGALARDIREETHDAQLIARLATQIPDEKVPHHPVNAAKVFLSYCCGHRTRPFKWMVLADGHRSEAREENPVPG